MITHIVQQKTLQFFFCMKKPHKIFFAQKNRKVLLASGLSIRQLSAQLNNQL